MIQLSFTQEQMANFEKKKDYVGRNLLSIKLVDNEIASICHTCDFDEQKIDAKIAIIAAKSKHLVLKDSKDI